MVQSIHFTKLTNDEFDSKLKTVLKEENLKKFYDLRVKLFKRKIKENEFVSEYLKIFKNIDLKFAFNLFPHFIRTIIH